MLIIMIEQCSHLENKWHSSFSATQINLQNQIEPELNRLNDVTDEVTF